MPEKMDSRTRQVRWLFAGAEKNMLEPNTVEMDLVPTVVQYVIICVY